MKTILGINKETFKVECKKKVRHTIQYWYPKTGVKVEIKEMDAQWIQNALNMLKRFKKKTPKLVRNYTSDWQYIARFEQELKSRLPNDK